jgi:hypothetical protein
MFAAVLQGMGVPAPHLMAWLTILTELLGGLAVLLGAFVANASCRTGKNSPLFLRGRVFHEGDDCVVVIDQATDNVLHNEFGILTGACGKLVELGLDLRREVHFHQSIV